MKGFKEHLKNVKPYNVAREYMKLHMKGKDKPLDEFDTIKKQSLDYALNHTQKDIKKHLSPESEK